VKVLLVDDHAIVRDGLRQLVAAIPGASRIGDADSGFQALARMREEAWDLVVLDISLPDRNGLDVLKQVKAMRPKLPVIILSMHDEIEYAVRALRAGAAGYLTKRSARTELTEAIQRVLTGRRYIPANVAEQLLVDSKQDADRPLEVLSDREFQVFCLIASGIRMKEVASQLGVSAKTVSTHRTNILAKLGLRSTAEMIRFAVARGLA
jgi:two-component system invasion response regulator UvrY